MNAHPTSTEAPAWERPLGYVCPKMTPAEARFVANLLAVFDRPDLRPPAELVPRDVDAVGMCRSLRMQARLADRELRYAEEYVRAYEEAEGQRDAEADDLVGT